MFILPLLLACTGAPHEETGEGVTLSFLAPEDGAVVPVGDVDVSVIVEGFTLTSPAKHNEGAPEGYILVTLDGAEVDQVGDTQFVVTLDAAGAHTIGAALRYADGDALDPAVSAEISVTAE